MLKRNFSGGGPIFRGSLRRISPDLTRPAAQEGQTQPRDKLQHSAARTRKQVDAVMLGLATLKQEGTHNKPKQMMLRTNTPTPQVELISGRAHENNANLRFFIEGPESAKNCAISAIQPVSVLGNRVVLYTDATYLSTRRMGGMAVVYKHFLTDNSEAAWVDKGHAAVFLDSSTHAESLAICNALETALAEIRTYYHGRLDGKGGQERSKLPRVMIFTDAQESLRALERHLMSDTTTKRYPWDRQTFAQARGVLKELEKRGVGVELHWVPGHNSQVEGNCRAHRLARHATDALECIVPDHPVRAHGQDVEMLSIEEIERRRRLSRQLELFQHDRERTRSELIL